MSHPMQAMLTERLVDTVFEALPEIARRARLWGLSVEEGDDQLILRTPGGFVSGFSVGTDPINRAVVLAMALVGGPLWTHAFPTLLVEVQRRWKAIK